MGMFTAVLPTLGDDDQEELESTIDELTASVSLFENVKGHRAWQLLLIVVLNLLDVVTTTTFLQMGVKEGNPLLAPVVHVWWAPLVVKGVIFVAIVLMVSKCPIRSATTSILLRMAVGYYVFVVGWNVWVIAQH